MENHPPKLCKFFPNCKKGNNCQFFHPDKGVTQTWELSKEEEDLAK